MWKNQLFLFVAIILATNLMGQTIIELGFYSVNGTFGLAAKNQYMILSHGSIIDNSDPTNPMLTGQYSSPGDGTVVLIQENYAFFGTGMTNDLYIADISTPSFPLHQSSLDFTSGNGVFGMDIKDDVLFVARGMDGIVASIDVSDKTNPVVLQTISIPGGQCRDIVIKDNYAFAAHNEGLKVIDISNTSIMEVVTSIGSGYNSIAMDGELVFLGKSSSGIDVFNIIDPLNPTPAFSIINTGGTAWDIAADDNFVYLATNSSGLFIYHVEANTGTEMANYPNSGNGQSFGVCLQDSLILLSGLINGVAVLQYSDETVGTLDNVMNQKVRIYPNPAGEFFTIDCGDTTPDRIQIFDTSGRLMKQPIASEFDRNIDISDLPSGVYLIRIESNRGIYLNKLLKR